VKKFVSMAIVAVMVLGFCASAFAADEMTGRMEEMRALRTQIWTLMTKQMPTQADRDQLEALKQEYDAKRQGIAAPAAKEEAPAAVEAPKTEGCPTCPAAADTCAPKTETAPAADATQPKEECKPCTPDQKCACTCACPCCKAGKCAMKADCQKPCCKMECGKDGKKPCCKMECCKGEKKECCMKECKAAKKACRKAHRKAHKCPKAKKCETCPAAAK